jgi:hypothetical protein
MDDFSFLIRCLFWYRIITQERGNTMERKYKLRSTDVWDEETQPILIGVVNSFEPLEVGDETRETMLIDTGTAVVRVWHSEALKEAFELAKAGDGIRLEFKGKIPLKGGKTFKRISVQVWEGGNLEEIRQEAETHQRKLEHQ